MRSLAALVGIWLFVAGAAAAEPASREIAFVSNAEEGTIALVDVARRQVVGRLDINPEHVRGDRGAASNYAQDSEVSPDGRTLYVSRGYVADLAAFDIATGRDVEGGEVGHIAPRNVERPSVRRDLRVLRIVGGGSAITAHVFRIDVEPAHDLAPGHIDEGDRPLLGIGDEGDLPGRRLRRRSARNK